MNASRETKGALDGVVVIDFTQMLSGPFAAMMLADQGARVIKIEPPGGDQTRKFGPFRPGQLTMLEGGYDLGSLARSAVAHMKVLAG